VFGENGAGKSTLLRIIAGMTTLSEGTLRQTSRWRKVSIGYLPQEGGIYRDLTVAENQQAFCRLLGKRRDSQSDEIAERLGLLASLDDTVGNLSGGFRRLAAMYCLLSTGANALVLDEPFSSLDDNKRSAAWSALQLVADSYVALVISEHTKDMPKLSKDFAWQEVWLKRAVTNVSAQA
jgi:ABC-type multidrug transport system ATPase subunit